LPLWWILLKGLAALQAHFGGVAGLWFRLPALAGDLAVCALAYHFARKRFRGAPGGPFSGAEQAGLYAGLAWALNPLAVLISAGHGQFDSLALALLLGMAWMLEYSRSPRAELGAALCLAAAIALKTWPLAFLPPALGALGGRNAKGRFVALALLPPLLLLLPWICMDGISAVAARLSYSGSDGLGLGASLKAVFFLASAPAGWRTFDGVYRFLALVLIGLAFVWALLRARSWLLLESLSWTALTLWLLAPGLSVQYLAWAPALALAVSTRLAWRLSLAALPLAAGFYACFMPVVLAGPAAWDAPRQGPLLMGSWALANLAWYAWTAREWKRRAAAALAPALRASHP
jgi:uncharacterized membrane protein